MKKIFNLAVILATLMGAATFTSCDDDEDDVINDFEEYGDAKAEVYVQAGQKYQAVQAGATAFTFEVKAVSGSVAEANQVVTFKIEKKGKNQEVTLGDDAAHCSYLAWTEAEGFKAVNKATADAAANTIVMVLAGASNTTGTNYMITTPTINNTLKANGAVETLFRVKTK